MGSTPWDDVVAGLRNRYCYVVPELPFGAHTAPIPDDADLFLRELATTLAEFLTEVGLR